MTSYAIRLCAGGYVGIRPGGAFRHVDDWAEAFRFSFMVTAIGIAENLLELAEGTYEIEPVPEHIGHWVHGATPDEMFDKAFAVRAL